MSMGNTIHGDLILTEDGYKTCDLYLAAFLSSASCHINKTSRDDRRVFFYFEENAIVEKLKADYYLRQAKIDALTYADNVKSLKSLCASIINKDIKRN